MITISIWGIAALLAVSATAAQAAGDAPDANAANPAGAQPMPYQLKPGQGFTLLKNWTFGNQRPDATIRNKADLDREFRYRYIWENGTLDKFATYWSYHRDYAEGDAKSLHVFGDNTLTLKGRIPPGGGLRMRGIESGMLRAKVPVTPGMYIEMRAKLTGGVGVWPNFWLEQGVENTDGTFTLHDKVMSEIDIFEFFNWDGRPQTRTITCNTHAWGGPEAHGNPYDMFTLLQDAGYEWHMDTGFDCASDFHVFALDWIENQPIWLLDGRPIKQTYYKWTQPAAHVVVASSIGMELPGVKQTQMVQDEKQWDYVIDYIRIWDHKPTPAEKLAGPTPYPRKDEDWPGQGVIRGKDFKWVVPVRSQFWVKREAAQGAIVFAGDSLTGGWSDLAKAFPNLKVANRGVGGDVSRGLLFRFKEDVLDLNPRAVVIEIGNNDLTALGSTDDAASNIAAMVDMAQKHNAAMPIVICTVPPSANPKAPITPSERDALNAKYRQIAAHATNIVICDLFAAMTQPDGSPNLEYLADDKLHLNAAGYKRWAQTLEPVLQRLGLAPAAEDAERR